MTTVAGSISISLDGYFTGPAPGPDQMLGVGGEVLHGWFAHDVADRTQLTAEEVLRRQFERTGALVMGRRSYETAEAAWGPHPPFEMPVLVLTRRGRPADVRDGTTFTFATDGFEDAVARARVAADGKDVFLHGGTAIQQGLRSGLLEELHLHVVPVVLGCGLRLFENVGSEAIGLQQVSAEQGPSVTHLTYRLDPRRSS